MRNYLFLLFSSITLLHAQPGSLDLSFDLDGKQITPVGSYDDHAKGIAIQPDGRIIAAGFSNNGTNKDFALVRYDINGALDNSFSSDGKTTTSIGTGDDVAYAVAVQPDGKIIAAGSIYNGTNMDFALVRYNTDGSLDNSFDIDGMVVTSIGTGDDIGYSMVLQPDGKIIVAGSSVNGSYMDFSLARYNSNGSLDNSFDIDGKVLTDFSLLDDKIFGITMQPDGKIVVAGYTDNGTSLDWGLARYNNDGSLDNSFSADGRQSIYFGTSYEVAYSLGIQSDGKIIVGGCTFAVVDDDFSLARFNPDGSLDNTFDGDGKVVTSLGADDWIFSLLLQADGKIVVAGYSGTGATSDFALVRYHTNGILDSTFDSDGIVITDFNGNGDMAYAAAIQPDLKIIAAGYTNNGTDHDFALARYLSGLNVGVVDFSSINEVMVYPNPVFSKFILEFELNSSEEISIGLMGLNGDMIKTFAMNEPKDKGLHKVLIDLPDDLPAGPYYLIIWSPKDKFIMQIINIG